DHKPKTTNQCQGKEQGTQSLEKVEITVTQKKSEEGHKAGQVLLDYSQLVNVVDKFKEQESGSHVEYGTVFFVQQEKHQYLTRYEEHGFELYHFKLQYENAFKEEDRFPFLILELKTKSELTSSE